MVSHRQERVSEMLREELSILISTELKDPRLEDAMIGVTDVRVTPDLRNARVYIQHALPAGQTRHVLAALRNSTSYLRRALVTNLNLRFVPELTFHVDASEERGRRVDEILKTIAHESHDETASRNERDAEATPNDDAG